MNEFEMRDELAKKREGINTFEDLTEFLKYVKENCNCGYGEAPRAMAQASLAVAWYLAKEFGITGFQAGCVMWDFVYGWSYTNNRTTLRMVDYDKMLYPQYAYCFEKTITPSTWEAIQAAAKKSLEEDRGYSVHPDVLAHWKSIIDGNVPFGYSVKEY